MRGSQRGWMWVAAGGGLALIGLGVFLTREGLQAAGAWAGIFSFFLAAVALGVTVWLGLRTPSAAGGTVVNSTAGRDINVVGRASSFSTGSGPAAVPPRRGRQAEDAAPGDGWISGSAAGRDINRADHLDGDFTTDDSRG